MELFDRIADTMYKTLYKYLEYLIQSGSDAYIEGKGCPYPKCKMHGVTMSIGEIRDHLANECNKIDIECNRCGECYKRPWI